MSLITIYHFATCPFSRTVRICLKEKGQDFFLINEKLWENRDEFLRINPAGTTPVLVVNEKSLVRGIRPAIEFIEEVFNDPQLIPGDPEVRAHIRYLFDWFTDKFYSEVVRYILNEKIIRIIAGDGSPNSAAIRAAKKNITYHLDYMDYLLSRSRYLSGEIITIADCAAAAQLSILDLVGDVDWDYSKRVKNWYCLMKSRPSVNSVLRDEIDAIKPPAHYINPDF